MSDFALQRIAQNKATRATSLDLGNCGLADVPVEIGELSWLESLSFGDEWVEWDGKDWQFGESQNKGPKNVGLVSLERLEKLPALRKLTISGLKVADIGLVGRLTNLTFLCVAEPRLSDLTPLGNLTSLRVLCVVGERFDDVSPLADLTSLEALAIAGPIASLEPLKGLTALRGVIVAGTNLRSLEALAHLTALSSIRVPGTAIADLTPLANLTLLKTLDVSNTKVTNFRPLSHLSSLESLDASDTELADLTALASLTSLETLGVRRTKVADFQPLGRLSSLKSLDVSNTELADLTALASLTSLETLTLAGTKVVDLAPLARLTALKSLDVSNTELADLTALASPTSIETLTLAGTKVVDLAPLARLTALKSLDVSNTELADLTALASLTSLETLTLAGTKVVDLAPLARLTALKSLDVSETELADLAPLARLTALKSLDVSNTELADLAALASLILLETLSLARTKVTDIEPLARLSSLKSLNVSNTELADLTALTSLTSLETLGFRGTKAADFRPLGRLSSLKSLDVSNTELADLTALASLTSLETLTLAGTKVVDLAPLARLTALKSLDVSNTELADLTALASLTSLETLTLAGTKVVDLAPLARLTALKSLDVSNTELADLTALASLTSLETLTLAGTKVVDLAPLARLTALKSLDVSNTELADLTALASLTSIERLTLAGTKVVELAPLAQLRALKSLDLSKTELADLTALANLPLRTLNVSTTRIADLYPLRTLIDRGLPIRWSSYTWEGDGIYVKDCPLVNPPVEIVNQGHAAVLNYFQERKAGDLDHLYEAKMLIVGAGGSGKTSLLRRLYQPDQPLPTEAETTKGIAIYRHDFGLPNGRSFRLNVWDFGGQEIYHATHQFFLTRRSLYVLVDDTRRDDRSVSDTGFKYWLELIDLFGDHSPVLIFQNEKGARSKAVDLAGIKGRYDNVKELYSGNLERRDAADRVREGINFFANNLSHIGEQLPARWIKVRTDIEARATHAPHITQQEYFEIYSQHMVFDRSKALHLSRYLHDLGVFLHFQDDPLLRRTIILQNAWATEAVFRILDDETVKGQFGRFTSTDCERLWRDSAYTEMHPELLALMQNFELCYLLTDTKQPTWLAPQLLPATKAEPLEGWGNAEDLVLRYRYEFMPKGLVNRLTVRLQRFVRDPRMAWVTGVLFQREDTAVLVELLASGGEIELRARGPERKALLSVVAADLDSLNESLQGLREKVDKRIPCNCSICRKATEPQFFAQKNLLKRKTDNRLKVECPVSYEDVDVLELLDGIRVDRLPGWANEPRMTAGERTIRIFLASSEELKEDRDAFDLYFRQQNDQLRKQRIYLEINRWENFLDAMSETRLQDEYNKAVVECDVFVSLFFTKTGKFTEEEFDTAHHQFKRTGSPRIYTFFKDANVSMGDIGDEVTSLLDFKKKLKELGHFHTSYRNTDDLKLQFSNQLDRLTDE